MVSTDGVGGTWTNRAVAIREPATGTLLNSPILQVGPDHAVHAFWLERPSSGANCTNFIMTRRIGDRGNSFGAANMVAHLVTTDCINGNLQLRRSNVESNDIFNAWPFPVPALNPVKTNHLYVVFADKGENMHDRADIFFTYSTDGGFTWSNSVRVNTAWINDQWMPVMVVHPNGDQLFLAWYDRRDDTNNAAIHLYGRWGSVGVNGAVTLDAEFRISSVSFPPVFSGGLTENAVEGRYDPVYPPGGVNLHWWYPEWPPPDPEDPNETAGSYASHVGEYNGAAADPQYVYVTWTDNRIRLPGTRSARQQSDIRFQKIAWPQ